MQPHFADRRWLVAQFMVAVGCLLLGAYAVRLNQVVYQQRAPVYDSMSYYTKLQRVMSTARYEGLPAAMSQTYRGGNTVALPLLVGAGLGKWLEPTRAVGVWIQTAQVLLLAALLQRYWRFVVLLSPRDAVTWTFPLLGLACWYYDNGGLSDFRMDLGLMVMYGATCLAYLVARVRLLPRDFWLLGLVAGLTLLSRATAPAYLVLGLGPLALLDLLPAPTRRLFLALFARAIAAAALVGGWFYLVNYDYLHYYYVVWNTDANARLPWSSSIRHGEFVLKHIGWAAGLWLLGAAVLSPRRPATRRPATRRPATRRPATGFSPATEPPPAVDWRLVWIGFAPLLGLVAGGAGHNPFVSMPAALGIFFAVLRPLAVRWASGLPGRRWIALLVLTLVCLALAAGRGYQRHSRSQVPSLAAHRAILQTMHADAVAHKSTAVRYGALHMNQMDATSLQNVLLFDTPACQTKIAQTIWAGVQLMPDLTFFRPAESDWRDIPGNDDAEKIAALLETAAQRIDYLVVPEPESIAELSTRFGHFVGNRRLATLRAGLLSTGVWAPLGDAVEVGPWERVRLWRNQHRAVHDPSEDQLGGG